METTHPAHDPAMMTRARSAAYSLIAHGFQYPDGYWFSSLRDRACWLDWPEQLFKLDPATAAPLEAIRRFVRCPDEKPVIQELQERYAELFGHTVRGSCPPYELEYGQSEVIQRAAELADIAGFYTAFGLEQSTEGSDRPDHVACECEYMAVLARKETHGLDAEDWDLVKSSQSAQKGFLSNHLGRWLPSFVRRIADADAGGFYGQLGQFAGAFLQGECIRLNVARRSAILPLRPSDPAEEALQECGPAESTGARRLTQLNVSSSRGA